MFIGLLYSVCWLVDYNLVVIDWLFEGIFFLYHVKYFVRKFMLILEQFVQQNDCCCEWCLIFQQVEVTWMTSTMYVSNQGLNADFVFLLNDDNLYNVACIVISPSIEE